MNFDFDEWAQLAKQDKIAFEKRRAATLNKVIASCASNDNELRKLNGLQFQVDMIRRKHKTAIGACIAISQMLMDHFYLLVTLDIDNGSHHANSETDKKIINDNVIAFDTARANRRINRSE